MKHRQFKRILSVCLALCLVFAAMPLKAYATAAQKQSELDKKNQEIKDTQSEVNQKANEQSQLASQISSIEKQIYSKTVELNNLNKSINQTKEEITQVLLEIEEKEKEIAVQNSALNERLRAMYENGSVGLLTVLFGSASMSAFLTNMEMAKRIHESDANMLASMREQYAQLDETKERLQTLKENLLTQQANAIAKKAELEAQKVDLDEKKSQVSADLKELEASLKAMKTEADALSAQIRALQGDTSYSGGTMLWPSAASKYISSPFGNRILFGVKEFHTGIDIAAALGTNILAANSGTVIKAGYNNSYGYMVMIDHGGGIVTLYAHSSKLLVKTGDVVGRGQVIALVGSTGRSTGPHLHFEVRVNGEYKNPLNYVSR